MENIICAGCLEPIKHTHLVRRRMVVDNSEYGEPDIWMPDQPFHEQCWFNYLTKAMAGKIEVEGSLL